MLICSIPLIAASVLLSPPSQPIADIFVDGSNANCATGTGSVGNPVCSIASAVLLASPGDTVRIAPGTYVENVVVGFNLELIGTAGSAVTILDGGGTGSVVTILSPVIATIDGLTLQNGQAPEGAGINVQGVLTLIDSEVSGNTATGTGGGGIGSSSGFVFVAITNSTISNNTAPEGGGIQVVSGSLSIVSSLIESNTAASLGGGIVLAGGVLTMTDSTVAGNQVTAGFGGGLEMLFGTTSVLRGSTISGNSASIGGGGVDAYQGTFSMANCTLSRNSALAYGAGISLRDSLAVTNTISNTTIANNQAGLLGGGIFNNGGSVSLQNSIVALNTGTAGFGLYADAYGPIISGGFNFVGVGADGFVDGINGDQSGTPNAPLDPLLGPLADNGGPTETHALIGGSPALDAANPVTFELTDQRGVSRPQEQGPDIGAVEESDSGGAICNGDGGNQMGCTNCPCGNGSAAGTIGGCLNSAGTAARLLRSGNASVSLPPGSTTDLRFGLSGAPASSFCILNSGDSVAPGNMANPCFGLDSGGASVAFDGLRCAIVNTRRHGGRSADTNGDIGVRNAPWGGEGNPAAGIAVAGAGFASGQTRFFQAINRDDPLAVCQRGLNTSQAVRVLFTP